MISFASKLKPSENIGLGQVKKKHVSRPRLLHFLAPPLIFYFFYEQRFYEQKPTGVTCKAHCCCVHTKIM